MPLLLSRDDVASVLTMLDCLQAVETAFGELARGNAIMPQRSVIKVEDHKGLFLGIEIIDSQATKRPVVNRTFKMVTECEDRGLLIGGGIPTGGVGTNTVRLCPPLVIAEEQVNTALNILKDVLSKI